MVLELVLACSVAQLARGGEHVCDWDEAVGPLASKLKRATRVEVFRLTEATSTSASVDLFRRKKFVGDERWSTRKSFEIAHYPVIAVDPDPAAELLPQILGVLRRGWFPCTTWTNEEGATIVRTKLCGLLRPVIAYRFQTPDGPMELLLCFGCDQAVLTFAGSSTMPIHIDFVARELLDLALTSFPFDPVLNGIIWEQARRDREDAWREWEEENLKSDDE